MGEAAELLGDLIAAALDTFRYWLLRLDTAPAERPKAETGPGERDGRDAPRP